jgi:hypothetical protein
MRYQLRYVRLLPSSAGNGPTVPDGKIAGGAAPEPTVIAPLIPRVQNFPDSTPHPRTKEAVMGIGTSIFLLALGAILTFAVNASIGGLDVDVVGWILMAAGVLGLVLTTLLRSRRRQTVATTTEEPVEYRRVEERRDVTPPM